MELVGSLPCSTDFILSHLYPVHTVTPCFCKSVLVFSSYLRLVLSNGPFSSRLPVEILYAFLVSPMRATRYSFLTILEIITLYQLVKSTIMKNLIA